jgi:RNA polymerase sigma-70 factor, ECF subfamily
MTLPTERCWAVMSDIHEQRSWAPKSADVPAWPGGSAHDPVRFGKDLAAIGPELRRYAMRLARDSDEASDLVQEAMARGWRARESFVPGTNLAAWLTRIMRNYFLADLRGRRRLVRDLDGSIASARVMDAPQEYAMALSELKRAMMRLPQPHIDALMVAAAGESYDDYAEAIGEPVGTIKSRVSRARQALGGDLAPWRVEGRTP